MFIMMSRQDVADMQQAVTELAAAASRGELLKTLTHPPRAPNAIDKLFVAATHGKDEFAKVAKEEAKAIGDDITRRVEGVVGKIDTTQKKVAAVAVGTALTAGALYLTIKRGFGVSARVGAASEGQIAGKALAEESTAASRAAAEPPPVVAAEEAAEKAAAVSPTVSQNVAYYSRHVAHPSKFAVGKHVIHVSLNVKNELAAISVGGVEVTTQQVKTTDSFFTILMDKGAASAPRFSVSEAGSFMRERPEAQEAIRELVDALNQEHGVR